MFDRNTLFANEQQTWINKLANDYGYIYCSKNKLSAELLYHMFEEINPAIELAVKQPTSATEREFAEVMILIFQHCEKDDSDFLRVASSFYCQSAALNSILKELADNEKSAPFSDFLYLYAVKEIREGVKVSPPQSDEDFKRLTGVLQITFLRLQTLLKAMLETGANHILQRLITVSLPALKMPIFQGDDLVWNLKWMVSQSSNKMIDDFLKTSLGENRSLPRP